jgi:hypothetical protein
VNHRLVLALAILLACCACAHAATERGLNFTVGQHGLDSLSYNGQSLLSSPKSGELQPAKSMFRAALDALLPVTPSPSPVAIAGKEGDTVELFYPWGRVSCAYRKKGENAMAMQIQIVNASTERLAEVTLRLVDLTFPIGPTGGTLEAGMFGFGFKGTLVPLYRYPQTADARFVVPVVRIDYGSGALNFCSDDLNSTVDVPYTTDHRAKTSYPFNVICRDIKPGSAKTFDVSLRFGPAGASVQDLASDIIASYRKKYPFQLRWNDHRPIGAIFLASSGINAPTNPRRWIMNSGKIDITTGAGKRMFHDALLSLADSSVKILQDAKAQGMITWDPNGQEFPSANYYGDPLLTPTLAPEMEFKADGVTATIDEYFGKFRNAGLKVGVCIRPQQIAMLNGKPIQGAADDEHAVQILKDKIAYAKERWGCTLFYVDSTTTAGRSLDPGVFKAVADAFPDVLLIPENESMRYFAYSAPLNAYVHFRVTSTPMGARLVYPNAFSVLMGLGQDHTEDDDALVEAIRSGDTFIFECWYKNDGVIRLKHLYERAASKGELNNQMRAN